MVPEICTFFITRLVGKTILLDNIPGFSKLKRYVHVHTPNRFIFLTTTFRHHLNHIRFGSVNQLIVGIVHAGIVTQT